MIEERRGGCTLPRAGGPAQSSQAGGRRGPSHFPPQACQGPLISHITYLLIIFRRSTPPQNRQLIVDYYSSKYEVDGFVGELASWYELMNTLCQINSEYHEEYSQRQYLDHSRVTRRGTTHSRDLSGRGAARAEDAQGTPTQSQISPIILAFEEQHAKTQQSSCPLPGCQGNP